MKRLIAWISDLRLAIGLLIVIAVASGLGTLVPQQESAELYHRVYDAQPWLGLLNGDALLSLQLEHHRVELVDVEVLVGRGGVVPLEYGDRLGSRVVHPEMLERRLELGLV